MASLPGALKALAMSLASMLLCLGQGAGGAVVAAGMPLTRAHQCTRSRDNIYPRLDVKLNMFKLTRGALLDAVSVRPWAQSLLHGQYKLCFYCRPDERQPHSASVTMLLCEPLNPMTWFAPT